MSGFHAEDHRAGSGFGQGKDSQATRQVLCNMLLFLPPPLQLPLHNSWRCCTEAVASVHPHHQPHPRALNLRAQIQKPTRRELKSERCQSNVKQRSKGNSWRSSTSRSSRGACSAESAPIREAGAQHDPGLLSALTGSSRPAAVDISLDCNLGLGLNPLPELSQAPLLPVELSSRSGSYER